MAAKDTADKRKKPMPRRPRKMAAAPDRPVVDSPAPVEIDRVLRKKDLFARVAAATGAKQGDVRLITEAVLDILGQALSAGETLALPPFGKARVSRQKALAKGELLIVRLRRGGGDARAGEAGNEGLEEADE